ncbi:hypothetical protein MHU86_5017 [Fragilaria crotonensis]|nr:hypothetical protein MHU86_5017 [Fragilaria crotonensis]
MGGRGVRRSTNRGSDESVRSAVSSVWSVLSTNTLGRWRSKEAYSSTTKRSQKTSNGVKYGQLVDDYEPVGGAGTLDNFLDGIANGEHESDTLGASSVAKTIHSQNTFMSYFSGRNRKSKNSSKRTGLNDSDSTSPSHTSSPKGKHRFFRLVLRRKNTNDTSSKAPSPPNDQRRFLRFTSRKKAKLLIHHLSHCSVLFLPRATRKMRP